MIIPCVLMLRFRCVRGAKIVHATRNSRIPRSGCRFDLWNPALRPLICGIVGFGGAFGRPTAGRRRAERRVKCVILIDPALMIGVQATRTPFDAISALRQSRKDLDRPFWASDDLPRTHCSGRQSATGPRPPSGRRVSRAKDHALLSRGNKLV